MKKIITELAAALNTALTHIGPYQEGQGAVKKAVVDVGNDALAWFAACQQNAATELEWEPMEACLTNARGEKLAEFFGGDAPERAHRVAACVNACQGIPTEHLEAPSSEWAKRATASLRPKSDRFDPLTIAYIAMGAQSVLDNEGGLDSKLSDQYEGQRGFIAQIIAYSDLLDRLGYEAEESHGLDGVFAYEVAEPFGQQYASALIDETGIAPEAIARELVDRISIKPAASA